MTKEEVAALIRESRFRSQADKLIGLIQESVRIDAKRVAIENLPLGASRIGGVPDLPSEMPFPTARAFRFLPNLITGRGGKISEQSEDKGLQFIAQLNIADLRAFQPAMTLPREGTLYFFYAPFDLDWSWDSGQHPAVVFYLNTAGQSLLRRTDPTIHSTFESFPCKLTFHQEWTIPRWIHYNYDFYEEYEDGYEEVRRIQDLISAIPLCPNRISHRLFGWPDEITEGLMYNSQMAARGIDRGKGIDQRTHEELQKGAKDWLLLLQIDTDEKNPGWYWGDGGTIYFVIHRDDLLNRRFNRIQVSEQCY
jgi:uncharacterized protein YwqG